jgi:tRNA dimethylallyltransferase
MQAIGYKQLVSHLKGELGLEDAVQLVKRDSRRYARRQLAWYRGDPDITWYSGVARVPTGEIAQRLGK